MFRFTRKPSSGSHSKYLAKITYLVKSGYVLHELYVSTFNQVCNFS